MKEFEKKGFYKPGSSDFMNNKTVIKIVMILLILFFGLQFLSHLFLKIGEEDIKKAKPVNINLLKWSARLSPFEAKPLLEYGYALLQESKRSGEQQWLEKSIYYLKHSLKANMLYYNAHLYSGKAYLARDIIDHAHFEPAVKAFKRAARIRGNDTRVSMDAMTILISLWPHLGEEDRVFCAELLGKSIQRIGRDEFNSLLENWALFSRDIAFFREGLIKRPQFYELAAKKLAQLETDMDIRREFLLKHSLYLIADFKDQYQKYQSEPSDRLMEKLKTTAHNLDNRISLYYLKKAGSESKLQNYFEFKKLVNLEILELLFAKTGWQRDKGLREEIETVIFSYIDDFSSMDESKNLDDYLTKKEFFNPKYPDLRVFYMKQLIAVKSAQYDNVINDVEKFKNSVSFIKKEFAGDYAEVLLLLVDSYISSRLLTSARRTLAEIRRSDVNLADFYLRKMIIEQIIGPDQNEDKYEKNQQYELIANSRFVKMDAPSIKKTLYLLNKREVEIRFTDALYEKIKALHLLQVFLDGNLIFEEYLSQLVTPARIPIPTGKIYSKHELAVEIK
jgi:hypothetical protein